MVALADVHLALDVVDREVLERGTKLVRLDAASLGDTRLEHALALPLLALELIGHRAVVLLLPQLDELLVLWIVDGEGIARRDDHAEAGVADGLHGRKLELLRQQRNLVAEFVLCGLGEEGVVVVTGQHEKDGVAARLADLGDIGRVVLGAGRREHLALELLAGPLHLALEHLDAVVTPGIIETERVELLVVGLLDVERNGARAHRPGRVGAKEIRHEAFRCQASVAVVGRNENRVPLGELWHHGQCLRGQRNAREKPAFVPLDHLLGFTDAGGRVAGGILDQQLDLLAEPAALFVLHFGVKFGAALLLLSDRPERTRQRQRHAELDRAAGLRLGAGPDEG